jgi:ubiquinone/menaquinone biosynthesis C-methylase UbiE
MADGIPPQARWCYLHTAGHGRRLQVREAPNLEFRGNPLNQRGMKNFWNQRARENAPFYIATWRGFDRNDTKDFFLSGREAMEFVRASGYDATGQDQMLEIGCGIGRMTHGFAELFGHVHAVDVSGVMIENAKVHNEHLANVSFYETNGCDLSPISDDRIDFCFSFIVFQHIPDKSIVANYLLEARRVLKPGGLFHFQLSGLPDPDAVTAPTILLAKRAYRKFIRRPVLSVGRRISNGPRGFESSSWAGTRFTSEEISARCREAGLAVLRISGDGTQYMWVTAKKPA